MLSYSYPRVHALRMFLHSDGMGSESGIRFCGHISFAQEQLESTKNHIITSLHQLQVRRFPKRIFNNNFWKRCVLHLLLLPDWTSSSGVFRCHGTNARCPGAALERLRHQFSFIFVFAVSHRSIDHLISYLHFFSKTETGKEIPLHTQMHYEYPLV